MYTIYLHLMLTDSDILASIGMFLNIVHSLISNAMLNVNMYKGDRL